MRLCSHKISYLAEDIEGRCTGTNGLGCGHHVPQGLKDRDRELLYQKITQLMLCLVKKSPKNPTDDIMYEFHGDRHCIWYSKIAAQIQDLRSTQAGSFAIQISGSSTLFAPHHMREQYRTMFTGVSRVMILHNYYDFDGLSK